VVYSGHANAANASKKEVTGIREVRARILVGMEIGARTKSGPSLQPRRGGSM